LKPGLVYRTQQTNLIIGVIEMTTVQAKRCPKCDTLKEVKEFNKHRNSPDGLQGYCKTCSSRAGREWYKANRQVDPYVYKVTCPDHKYYYGSSTIHLDDRIRLHFSNHRTCALAQHVTGSGWTAEDCDVYVIGTGDLNTVRYQEAMLIQSNLDNEKCLNVRGPDRKWIPTELADGD
jgi:hypothetical protein